MVNLEIINENALSMNELKEKLDSIKKRDGTLTPRGIKTYDYIARFMKKDMKKIREFFLLWVVERKVKMEGAHLMNLEVMKWRRKLLKMLLSLKLLPQYLGTQQKERLRMST